MLFSLCFFRPIFFSTGNIIDDDDGQCADNEFLCDYDKCISKAQECDGTLDCNDQTDELNCPQHQGLYRAKFYCLIF